MKRIFFIFALFIFTASSATAQTPQPTATPTKNNDDDVVKISTNLIQLDVVVTDKNGNLVTGLKPEDFEITENGERQTITNLSYFAGQKNTVGDANLNAANSNTPQPSVGEVRRTIGIVIDDAGLSAQSINLVKKQMVKFITEEVQPNDLVAIIKTSGSVGVLQQFTTDKAKLLDIIDSLKYRPLTGSGLSPFTPISISFAEQIKANSSGEQLNDKFGATLEQRTDVEFLNDLNKNFIVTAGSLGVLNSTISAMRQLPGRKSVLYIAEGVFSLFDAYRSTNNGGNSVNSKGAGGGSFGIESGGASIFTDSRELEDKLRGITEIANRATIAIYTLDPRGTAPVGFSADDSQRGGMTDRENGGLNEGDLATRNNRFKASQLGLKFLSEETSGKAFVNTNDLGKGLREALDSQNGYYLLGYEPDSDTFDVDKRRFNKISVKVKRPNLNVSYRSGFFNVAETPEEKNVTPQRTFLQKLFSPYRYSDVKLQMTSVFAADEQTATVRSFVKIEPNTLQFKDGADNMKTASFDIVAVAFNDSGIPTSQAGKRFDIKVSPQGYAKLLQDGIICNLAFATKLKGSQQIKIAVRDVNTNQVGTASQTINTPDFDKNKLSLSGIILQNFTPEEWQKLTGGKNPLTQNESASRMQTDTARRQFKKGTILSFNYVAYAAPSLRSKSQTQFAVLKDGKEIFKGKPEDLIAAPGDKTQRINKGGAFILGADMAAGKYILQITVSGDALKEPEVQQIDFELLN